MRECVYVCMCVCVYACVCMYVCEHGLALRERERERDYFNEKHKVPKAGQLLMFMFMCMYKRNVMCHV